MTEKIKINVDNKILETEKGKLLIEACEDNGIDIPRFCWHKRMDPVGMCRMCLVQVETPRGMSLVPSCTADVTEDMIVDTTSDTVKKAQEGVLEFLLINHPLDCPICDRAGECPLQDQTMTHGPGESRFIEEKRKFEKPIPISDLILLDRERCVLCDRCTRFSEEISGDPLIQFVQRGNNTQVLTFPDEPFNSYFSGNTVQLCPVGALTSTSYRFKARPWDLKSNDSTCNQCSVGCSIDINVSQEKVLRYLGIDNENVNQGWLCDKGRYGFEYIHSNNRIITPKVKVENEFIDTTWKESLNILSARIKNSIDLSEDSVAFIGGSLGTNEDHYALAYLLKEAIKTSNIYSTDNFQLSTNFILGDYSRAIMDDLDQSETIVIWGQDIKETLPILYLRVKRAVKNGAKLVVIGPKTNPWSELANLIVIYEPGEELDVTKKIKLKRSKVFQEFNELIQGKDVTYLVGKSTLGQNDTHLEHFVSYIIENSKAKILPLVNKSNSLGKIHMGLFNSENNIEDFINKAKDGKIKTLIITGSDFITSSIYSNELKDAMTYIEYIVAIDMFVNETSQRVDTILPVTTLPEKEGTFTNFESRVSRQRRSTPIPGQAKSEWEIVVHLLELLGFDGIGHSEIEINKLIEKNISGYREASFDNLDKPSNQNGLLVSQTIPYMSPEVYSQEPVERDEYKLIFYEKLYGDKIMQNNAPSISFLGANRIIEISPKDAKTHKIEQDTNIKLVTGDDSIVLKANIDQNIEPGTLCIPINRRGVSQFGKYLYGKIEKISEGELLNVD